MAFPFKNGVDFYNCEAQRMALHNLGANPTETATGLMYFNTGASNLGKHAVVHDGTNFKALAFVDEIATNAEFVELKEKVDLLIGDDVDTDTIIDSWKEVQAFLAGIEDTKTLQGMLSSYLPKSGGTMQGVITMPTNYQIQWGDSTRMIYGSIDTIEVYAPLGLFFNDNKVLDAGNYSSYALPLSGGTLSGNLDINTETDTTKRYFRMWYYASNRKNRGMMSVGDSSVSLDYYSPTDGEVYQITVGRDGFKYNANYVSRDILHSGNIGEYAMFEKSIKILTSSDDLNNYYDSGYFGWKDGENPINSIGDNASMLAIKGSRSNDAFQLVFARNTNDMHYRTRVNSTNWQPWKTIAFTDSTVAAAQKLVTSAGVDAVTIDGYIVKTSSALSVGTFLNINRHANTGALFDSSKMGFEIEPSASCVTIKGYNTSGKGVGGIILNSSGNVGIGTLNPKYELDVNGGVRANGVYVAKDYGLFLAAGNEGIYLSNNSLSWHNTSNAWDSSLMNFAKDDITLYKKTTIKGDLYVEGNIVTTKESSAGGVGQEGESGDGGAEVISQPLAKGQSTYTITNTIKRSDIAVSLYEANVINGQTIWSLCLADIEVTNDTITVTFGSATSVNHKLVAVG